MIKTPTWYVFHMYKNHMDADFLESFVSTQQIGPENARVNAVTSSASKKDGSYTITLTNADLKNSRKVCIKMDGLEKISSAEAKCLCGKKMNSMNTFDNPDEVVEKDCAVSVNGNIVEITLPERSVVSISLK